MRCPLIGLLIPKLPFHIVTTYYTLIYTLNIVEYDSLTEILESKSQAAPESLMQKCFYNFYINQKFLQ